MSTKLEKYKAARQQLDKLKKQASALAKTAFEQGIEDLFKRHRCLSEIAWNQYTPYFNDGAPCEFSANIDWPYINGEEFDDPSEDTLEGVVLESEGILEAKREVLNFLRQFDNEDYEEMFGDHVRVIATRNGITTEEYDHD